MAFLESGAIRYLTSDSLDPERVTHAFFTRRGGVSPSPWDSLNFGSTVGDKLENVVENRQRALTSLNLKDDAVYDVWQVHSREVAIASRPRLPTEAHLQADIILTDCPGVVLLMRFADCVPLLFYDPKHHVAGIAHAGWQGTVLGVVKAVVDAMYARFHTDPRDLVTVIGPSIGPDHYQIGPEVVDRVNQAFGESAPAVLINRNGSTYLDLWSANQIQLEQCGVTIIETLKICTACHMEDWYSHRGQFGKAGRYGVVMVLKG